jgi:hypothetical protein
MHSTIIESAKVAYHWKTGQKNNIFGDHLSHTKVSRTQQMGSKY